MTATTINTFPSLHSWSSPRSWALAIIVLLHMGFFWALTHGLSGTGGRTQDAQPVMLTRLHIRYTKETFPEDLAFQETKDRENFQGRYVLRHPWKGDANKCPAAAKYFDELKVRQEKDAQTLAKLTGWEIGKIRDRMKLVGAAPKAGDGKKWWQKIWKD